MGGGGGGGGGGGQLTTQTEENNKFTKVYHSDIDTKLESIDRC